jgi:hypothetical protein
MISLLATIMLQVPTQNYVIPESVARYCATTVGIPYASDNFSDREWEQFKSCTYKETRKKK